MAGNGAALCVWPERTQSGMVAFDQPEDVLVTEWKDTELCEVKGNGPFRAPGTH